MSRIKKSLYDACLESNRERLLKEWCTDKNIKSIRDVAYCSNQTAFWKCLDCEHEWQAKISNRWNGRGCPKCSNKVLIKGDNDLLTKNPQLAEEWDDEKNGMTPSEVFPKTAKKYWWKCPVGHSYQASPLHRSQGTGCPICNNGRQTSFAEQAIYFYIKKAYPDAISRYKEIFGNGMELDIFIPSIRYAIEYDGAYYHRVEKAEREKRKYDICKNNSIKLIRIKEYEERYQGREGNWPASINADYQFEMEKTDNSLSLNKGIQRIIDLLAPDSNIFTKRNFKSRGSCIRADVENDRTEILRYKTITRGSLEEKYPDIAVEWDKEKNGTLTPSMFLPGSDYKAYWRCKKCNCVWQTTIAHRVEGTGCPQCYMNDTERDAYKRKAILQCDLEGNVIKEWISISEAARQLGLSVGNISSVLQCKRNQCGGYIWKYSG